MIQRNAFFLCLAGLGIIGFSFFQNFTFSSLYGSVSITGALDTQATLAQVLSRPITMQHMTDAADQYPQSQINEDMTMIDEIKPTFIGRWGGWWGGSWDTASDNAHFARAVTTGNRIHQTNPQTVLEAAVFEYINANVSNIAVPAWAFTELGMPVQTRNFDFNAMKFNDSATNQWHRMGDGFVPDLTKSEARLWLYYRARRYVDSGAEAIHLGQAKLMGDVDYGYYNLWNLVSKIRAYGRLHARRQRVLVNAHSGWDLKCGSNLIFDFNESPLRLNETSNSLKDAVIDPNYRFDSIYEKSQGGLTPAGEIVNRVPYLVEFDNFGISSQPGVRDGGGDWYIFGYDEITWFSYLAETDRNNWLAYAANWLKTNDPTGHLEMPGRRGTTRPNVPWPGVIYRANRGYFNQVSTIKCIWGDRSCMQVATIDQSKLSSTVTTSPTAETTSTVTSTQTTSTLAK